MLRIVRAALVAGFVSVHALAGVVYVDADASGANNGSSWANAFADLQAGLAIAVPGDEVWVAAGTYKPTTTADRTISFVLRTGVGIYGGFAGTETQREERNPAANVAILSGEIRTAGIATDNSYYVVRAGAGLTETTVLDGFTVTEGRPGLEGSGGGILITGGSPTLANLSVVSNSRYGLRITGGSPTVTRCRFLSNTGNGISATVPFTCRSCDVRANIGDGISYQGDTTLINTVVAGNSGRGILVNSHSAGTLVNCTIAGNGSAGVYLNNLFPAPVESSLNLTVRNTIIWGNASGITGRYGLGFPPPSVSYSDIQSWTFPGTGNLRVDPFFFAPPDDLRLGAGSPALDAGNNAAVPVGLTTDFAGHPRFTDDPSAPDTGLGSPPIVDMGAYEAAYPMVTAPGSTEICSGEDAVFSVSAAGPPPLAYQWRRNDVPLADGGRISGAATKTLTITGAIPDDSGAYDVVVTDGSSGSVDSAEATLDVNPMALVPAISAPFVVPPASTGQVASVPGASGSAWTWTLSGGSITGGQGTNQITFDAGPAGKTMRLTVTDPSWGCPTSTSQTAIAVDFLDVPSSDPFHDFIAAIARAGITGGCGDGNYCRSNPITRAQMAVFLLKAEHGAGYEPPACEGQFADVPCSSPFARWVERLVAEGISVGCGSGYCPDYPVLRQQMAVFLLRAEHGLSYAPPDCAGLFADVPCAYTYARWIEALHTEGVSGGCGVSPLRYCPLDPITRGQMAVFLTKAFHLPLP